MTEKERKELLSGEMFVVAEAAKKLKLSRSTMYQKIAAGEIEHLRVGTSIRIPSSALQRYAEACLVGAD